MKKSELKNLIKESVREQLNEGTSRDIFKAIRSAQDCLNEVWDILAIDMKDKVLAKEVDNAQKILTKVVGDLRKSH